jgi:hypothetical protein
LGDVLQLGNAEVLDVQWNFTGCVRAHPAGDADAARLGQRLQLGGDDHAVAQQVVAVRYHLALMHADAKAQPVALRPLRLLDRDGATQRLYGAGEGNKEAIAGGLEHPASCAAATGSTTSVRSARTRASAPRSSAPTIPE